MATKSKKLGIGGTWITGLPATMSSLFWNCRGLGDPHTVQVLLDLVQLKKPMFVFLMETMIDHNRIDGILAKMKYEGLFTVFGPGHWGGLALFWKRADSLKVISSSQNYIDSEVFDLFSRNTTASNEAVVSQTLQVPIRNDSLYLGLPKAVSRNKAEVFRYIKDKIWERLQSWKGLTLSRGGKEILIKSVVQSIPSYVSGIFLLPKRLCEEIEILMNKFWWLSDVNKNSGIRWMSWSRLCYPKKYGGMGFRRIHEFNVAMLGKQAWRILTEPNSFIARLLKARYFPTSSFGEAGLGNNSSFVWRSITKAKHLVCNGSVLRIGKGDTVNVWKDPWLIDSSCPRVTTHIIPGMEDIKVSSLMSVDRLEWDIDILRDLFNENIIQQILKIPISQSREEDVWLWLDEANGAYSVKSGYHRLCQIHTSDSNTGNNFNLLKIWRLSVPPKVKIFIWRACQNCLPSLDNLCRKYVEVYPICPICQSSLRTSRFFFALLLRNVGALVR